MLPVKESSGDGEERPVLLGLRDGRRRLEQPGAWRGRGQGGLALVNILLQLLRLLAQAVGGGRQVGQAGLAAAGEDLDSLLHVSQVESVLELAAGVLPDLSDLGHLLQLLQVAGYQVEEGEFVEVLGSLVSHLNHLVVPLQQRGLPEFLPALLVVQTLGGLQGGLDVAALQRQAEPGLVVLHEVESNLGVTLLLQVGDDALPHQLGVPHHVEHLLVLPVHQGQLELELGGVDVEDPGLALPVQAEHLAALDPGEIDRQVQGPDDPVVPVGEGVLDVVAGGVDEHAAVVPGPGLHSGVLVDRAEDLQLPGGDRDDMLGEEGHHGHIGRPDDVATLGNLDRAQASLLLDIKQRDRVGVPEEQHPSAGVENLVTVRDGDLLGDLVLQVLDDERVTLVQDGEPVSRHPDGREPTGPLAVRRVGAGVLPGQAVQVVGGVLRIGGPRGQQDRVLRLVVAHGVDGRPAHPDLHDGGVPAGGEVQLPQVFLLHVVEDVAGHGVGGSLPLQLEDDHPAVVTGSEQVESGVAGQDPEPVVLSPEGVEAGPLAHVPHSDGLVLAVGEDQLLPGVEDGAGDVVVVAAARVHLPGLQGDLSEYLRHKHDHHQ